MTPSAQVRMTAISVDLLVESPLWEAHTNAANVIRRAIAETATVTSTRGGEIAIVLSDDSTISTLNRNWRGVDAPTNVLSFPARQAPASTLLGDIVLAYETIAREAAAERKAFEHHLGHLAVHGFLHLLGHDHETDAEAAAMEGLEREILARLGIPDPYAACGGGS